MDTFEAVKVNVGGLLGELAPKLAPEQLELLFRHFGACTAWPAPMALRAMDLLYTLAKGDEQVPPCRVLGFQHFIKKPWSCRPCSQRRRADATICGRGVPQPAALLRWR